MYISHGTLENVNRLTIFLLSEEAGDVLNST